MALLNPELYHEIITVTIRTGHLSLFQVPRFMMMLYLFITVPHLHGHWQLEKLLGNQISLIFCSLYELYDETGYGGL